MFGLNDEQQAVLQVLVCLLVATYLIGGLHGLWLAWSQPRRMLTWATGVFKVWRESADTLPLCERPVPELGEN